MTQKPRVLLVSRPATGGMRMHLRRLARGLSDEFEFALAAPGELPEEVGIRGKRMDIPDRLSPFALPFLVMRLGGIARRERARIVHAHGYVAGVVASMATPGAGRVVLCTLHNLFPASAGAVGRRALQICGRSCTRLIAITEAVKASAVAAGVDPGKIVVIPNGIELAPFDRSIDRAVVREGLGITADAPLVVTASRMIPAKGLDVLLRATAELRKAFPALRVLIAGDGPQRAELESLAAELELGGTVRFLGEREDIPVLLKASDAVAVPSLFEGQSLLVLEGMAARLPVVASNVGGMAEMIRDGETGLLVPAGDAVSLSLALGLVLKDRVLAGRLGEEGRRFVEEEMTLDRMLQRTRELYLEELARASGH